jgi:hypothetical protein
VEVDVGAAVSSGVALTVGLRVGTVGGTLVGVTAAPPRFPNKIPSRVRTTTPPAMAAGTTGKVDPIGAVVMPAETTEGSPVTTWKSASPIRT